MYFDDELCHPDQRLHTSEVELYRQSSKYKDVSMDLQLVHPSSISQMNQSKTSTHIINGYFALRIFKIQKMTRRPIAIIN